MKHRIQVSKAPGGNAAWLWRKRSLARSIAQNILMSLLNLILEFKKTGIPEKRGKQ